MASINTYIHFNGNAEEAYTSQFLVEPSQN